MTDQFIQSLREYEDRRTPSAKLIDGGPLAIFVSLGLAEWIMPDAIELKTRPPHRYRDAKDRGLLQKAVDAAGESGLGVLFTGDRHHSAAAQRRAAAIKLVERGLLTRAGHDTFRITDAGRAALAE